MNWFKCTILPLTAAVMTAAVISAVWYSPFAFGTQWIALRSQALHVPPDAYIAPWKKIAELIREVVVAYVILHLIRDLKIDHLKSALRLGIWIWLGFPFSMLVGASLWDNKPWALSLIHGGDWFTKMIAMSAVIVLSRRLVLPRRTDGLEPHLKVADAD